MKFFTLIFIVTGLLITASATGKTDAMPPIEKATPETKPAGTTSNSNIRSRTSLGQLLYENHCTKCHTSIVHIRERKKAKNIQDVQAWVGKWQTYEKLNWDEKSINAVADYLVMHYYKFK